MEQPRHGACKSRLAGAAPVLGTIPGTRLSGVTARLASAWRRQARFSHVTFHQVKSGVPGTRVGCRLSHTSTSRAQLTERKPQAEEQVASRSGTRGGDGLRGLMGGKAGRDGAKKIVNRFDGVAVRRPFEE